MLQSQYSDGIEVKTYLGDASLRRRLTKCNQFEIATISSGLPLKEKKMLDAKTIQSEAGLRSMIEQESAEGVPRPAPSPSVDFIKKILDEAYETGMSYDVTDLKPPSSRSQQTPPTRRWSASSVVQMKWKFQSKGGVDHFAEEIVPDEPSINQEADNAATIESCSSTSRCTRTSSSSAGSSADSRDRQRMINPSSRRRSSRCSS